MESQILQKLNEEWTAEKFSSLLNQEIFTRFKTANDLSIFSTPVVLRFLMSVLSLRKNGLKSFSSFFESIFKDFQSKDVDDWIKVIVEILSEYLTQQCLTTKLSLKNYHTVLSSFENYPRQETNLRPLFSPYITKSLDKVDFEKNPLQAIKNHTHFACDTTKQGMELLAPIKYLEEKLKDELKEKQQKIGELSPTRPKFNFEQSNYRKNKKSSSGIFISKRNYGKSSSRKKKKEMERKKKEKLRQRKKAEMGFKSPTEKRGIQMIDFSESVTRMTDLNKRSRKRKRDTSKEKEKQVKKKKISKRKTKKVAPKVSIEDEPTDTNPFSKNTVNEILLQPKIQPEDKIEEIKLKKTNITQNPPSSIFGTKPSSVVKKTPQNVDELNKSKNNFSAPPSSTLQKQFRMRNESSVKSNINQPGNYPYSYSFTPSGLFPVGINNQQKNSGGKIPPNMFNFNSSIFKGKSSNPFIINSSGKGNANRIFNPKNLTPIQPKIVRISHPGSTIVGKHDLTAEDLKDIQNYSQKKGGSSQKQKRQINSFQRPILPKNIGIVQQQSRKQNINNQLPPRTRIIQPPPMFRSVKMPSQLQSFVNQPLNTQKRPIFLQKQTPVFNNPQAQQSREKSKSGSTQKQDDFFKNAGNIFKTSFENDKKPKKIEKKEKEGNGKPMGMNFFPSFHDIRENRI